jgi:hypothetical protein
MYHHALDRDRCKPADVGSHGKGVGRSGSFGRLLLRILALLGISSIAAIGTSHADVRLPAVFPPHMVLQQQAALPVWGWEEPGEEVVVSIGGQSKHTEAGRDGKWKVELGTLKAGDTLALTVKGKNTLRIDDVLVGEVWLCSGQSNMEMVVNNARDAEQETAAAQFPQIRVFRVDRKTSLSPEADCIGRWEVCSPETAGKFSAMAYFFGRELHQKLKVPIGLMVAAWSGSKIEAWTRLEVQRARPELNGLLADWHKNDIQYTETVAQAAQAEYQQQFDQWKAAFQKGKAAGKPTPKAPRRPVDPREHWHHPAVLFNGMIAPLIPYAIRGAIWYQGESNADTEQSSALYAMQLPLLIEDWRQRWGQGDFPFGGVQLPLISAERVHWARIRDSMLKATSLPNAAMVVTFDLGEPHLLHPKNKQAFAHRLALWARAAVYGEEIPWSGPRLTADRIRDGAVELEFTHTDGGLIAQGGELKGFEVAGAERQWKPARARIQGKTVVVSAAEVKQPAAVRYAWANDPQGNLFNGAGLPASPFRTDDWPE